MVCFVNSICKRIVLFNSTQIMDTIRILLYMYVTCSCAVLTVAISDSTPIQLNIGTMFWNDSFDSCTTAFNRSVMPTNSNLTLVPIHLKPLHGAWNSLLHVCDALTNRNISLFVAVGSTEKINILSIVTSQARIPLLGYTTDKPREIHTSERPYYVELKPRQSYVAEAISKMLSSNNWNSTCLLIQEDYITDNFHQSLAHLSVNSKWHIEDTIRFDVMDSSQVIHNKILSLQENECTILIIHTNIGLAKRIFYMAKYYKLLGQGYAWLLTDAAYSSSKSTLEQYPIGAIAFKHNKESSKESLAFNFGYQLKKGIETIEKQRPDILRNLMNSRNCFQTLSNSSNDLFHLHSTIFKSYLENSTRFGQSDDILSTRNVKLLNLVTDPDRKNTNVWKSVGIYKEGGLKLTAIKWPGDTVVGPSHKGQRVIRVVTNIVPPFVMEHDAILGNCSHSVPCLRVHTKDKNTLDGIFDDYINGAKHAENIGDYEVKCCQGFSITFLESIALELNFAIRLYITADNRYGDIVNGSWTGMVQDLTLGLAHMAVASLSVTKKRTTVIDFTHPYYYSSFAILVSEKKKQIPIYAFTEPFDQWVWISIVISAIIVAVVLSVFEWNSPFGLNPWGRKRKSNYTLGSGLNMVYAILFGHTVKTKSPKAWPSKWLQNFWAAASIVIYSSYTANLAAFLAGKNSGVTISGIYDTKLLQSGHSVGIIGGTAAEEYVHQVNHRLLLKATRLKRSLQIGDAMKLLMNDTLDAYIDDSPILEYARETMDAKCKLHMVNSGFGEDSYGIGLPKTSWLKTMLNTQIMKYHENGYIEEIRDRFFRRNRCSSIIKEELQGQADRMEFNQHAGLYLILAVGIFMCVVLLLLEHATFKWLVPYWRLKQKLSFWKSMSMMFWSQRLYRIITSEELVSPHHSAREMIEVMKNRDFTKLFQKSVKKQEKLVRNRKNLFSVVEQLQWKQLRSETEMSNQSSMKSRRSIDEIENCLAGKIDKKLLPQLTQNKCAENEVFETAKQANGNRKLNESKSVNSKDSFDDDNCNTYYRSENPAERLSQSSLPNMVFESLDNSDYLDEEDYLTYCFSRNNKTAKGSGDCIFIPQEKDKHVDCNYLLQK